MSQRIVSRFAGGVIMLVAAVATMVVIGLLVAVPVAAQGASSSEDRVLPAAASPPPDVAEDEKQEKVKPPQAGKRATVAELAQKIKGQKGGPEKLEKAKAKQTGTARAAAVRPPKDVEEDEKQAKVKPPQAGKRASAAALAAQVRKQPGGAAKVDKAKGGKKPGKQSSLLDRAKDLLAELNPFRAEEARAGATYTLTLTPQLDNYGRRFSSSNPRGYAYFYGARFSYWNPSNSYARLNGRSRTWASGVTSVNSGPAVWVGFSVPTTGWYIVSTNMVASADIELRHYESGPYVLLQTFPSRSGAVDYPSMQYLTAGWHYFVWRFKDTYRGGYIYRITVDSYP